MQRNQRSGYLFHKMAFWLEDNIMINTQQSNNFLFNMQKYTK